MIKLNPFTPGAPVPTGLFVGRLPAIECVESGLLQTRASIPNHVILTGERGIGKTSLLKLIRHFATGAIEVKGETLNFVTVDVDLTPNTTQSILIQRITNSLQRELGRAEKVRKFFSETWDFVKRLEAGGVSLKESPLIDEEILSDNFAYSLAETVKRLRDSESKQSSWNCHRDGILLLIDEADNCSKDLQLGRFLKLLTERLSRHNCENVMIILTGLPEVKEILSASHLSSLRIFSEIPLERLSNEEVGSVIRMCLDKADKEFSNRVEIDDEAIVALIQLSEGYPHFIQQFGHSAFESDKDNRITIEDVLAGAFGKNGAMIQIGERYYRNDFYGKIQKESYRQVLRIMAENADGWVTKQEIRSKFRGNEGILNNAIKALRDRHIIIPREGVKGVYRLQHKGFATWIKVYTEEAMQSDLQLLGESEN